MPQDIRIRFRLESFAGLDANGPKTAAPSVSRCNSTLLHRAESKTGPLAAPTHSDGNPDRDVLRREEPGRKDKKSVNGSVAGGREAPRHESEIRGGNEAGHARGQASGSGGGGGRKSLEMRRDVEERVVFLKGLVRECDEEVGQ